MSYLIICIFQIISAWKKDFLASSSIWNTIINMFKQYKVWVWSLVWCEKQLNKYRIVSILIKIVCIGPTCIKEYWKDTVLQWLPGLPADQQRNTPSSMDQTDWKLKYNLFQHFTINGRTVDNLTLLNSSVPLSATPTPSTPCSTRSSPPPPPPCCTPPYLVDSLTHVTQCRVCLF